MVTSLLEEGKEKQLTDDKRLSILKTSTTKAQKTKEIMTAPKAERRPLQRLFEVGADTWVGRIGPFSIVD